MRNSIKTLGASNLCVEDRAELDFYETRKEYVKMILPYIDNLNKNVWECCAGQCSISDVIKETGRNVFSSDIVERNRTLDQVKDLFEYTKEDVPFNDFDIVSNPPYDKALEIINKCLELVNYGNNVVMLLRLQFLESYKRYKNLFSITPPEKLSYL